MPRPSPATLSARRPRRLRLAAVLAVAGVSGAALAAVTGLALASAPTTLGIGKNVHVLTKVENIVVNSKGVTVYTLSGETKNHQTCTKASGCFAFWFPVKVASSKTKLTAAKGIKGRLSTISRNGFHQVTLDGHPLYTFKLDNNTKGQAIGEGIPSFGGVWHVVVVAATKHGSTHTTTTTTTTITTSTSTNPHGY